MICYVDAVSPADGSASTVIALQLLRVGGKCVCVLLQFA